VLSAENCSDVVWRAYIKHSTSEIVQPFLMIAPPTQRFFNTNTQASTSAATPTARQFILPLSQDPALTVHQISRIDSKISVTAAPAAPTAAMQVCNPDYPSAGNSPLCAGIVIYSLTLYRM
jgi:hypothetical protein